jgi:hypothetical protein
MFDSFYNSDFNNSMMTWLAISSFLMVVIGPIASLITALINERKGRVTSLPTYRTEPRQELPLKEIEKEEPRKKAA